MHKHSLNKIALIGLTSFFLTACGGGGGDSEPDKKPVTPPPVETTFSLNKTVESASINEFGTHAFSLTASDVSGTLTATHTYSGQGDLLVTSSGNTVNVTFSYPELMQDVTDKFNIDISDSKTTKTVAVTLAGKNTSIEDKFSLISTYANLLTNRLLFTDIENLHQFYNSAAKLIGKISAFDADENTSSLQSIIATAYSALDANEDFSVAQIDAIKSKYDLKEVTEKEVDDLIAILQIVMQTKANNILESVNLVADHSDKLPAVDAGPLEMVVTGLSQFVGNDAMGSYVNGQWVFNDKYALVGKILSANCSAE
jgi:hypothetical protein